MSMKNSKDTNSEGRTAHCNSL